LNYPRSRNTSSKPGSTRRGRSARASGVSRAVDERQLPAALCNEILRDRNTRLVIAETSDCIDRRIRKIAGLMV